jgi:hypothetical protein
MRRWEEGGGRLANDERSRLGSKRLTTGRDTATPTANNYRAASDISRRRDLLENCPRLPRHYSPSERRALVATPARLKKAKPKRPIPGMGPGAVVMINSVIWP